MSLKCNLSLENYIIIYSIINRFASIEGYKYKLNYIGKKEKEQEKENVEFYKKFMLDFCKKVEEKTIEERLKDLFSVVGIDKMKFLIKLLLNKSIIEEKDLRDFINKNFAYFISGEMRNDEKAINAMNLVFEEVHNKRGVDFSEIKYLDRGGYKIVYLLETENDKVIIVDQFTGRLMQGRQFSEGLHQAIEAKEGVTINTETKTMATITFQNLFRMYNKLSGMTGTAKTEEEEFRNIYNMYVIEIPTNKPVIREDLADLVYANEKAKYKAIISTVKEIHATGRPILIGTISVEANEYLSKLLTKAGLKHEVLNAKNHEREAEIIAKAGEKEAITLATNMAGRGTDIKLGEGVRALGGLCVIGTERHESRRIDNQLRGRAGRQGDPGMSQFFVSFEDDLMRRFGTERIKGMLESLGVGDQAIRSKALTRSIESAQKKVEGNNYDIRKSLLDYDNVLNEQREIIYARRNEILDMESIHERVIETFKNVVHDVCAGHIEPEGYLTEADKDDITEYVNNNYLKKNNLKFVDIKDLNDEETEKYITDLVIKDYEDKIKDVPVSDDFEKAISLRVIDSNWVEHMSAMEHLKEGIGLRGYGQVNPVQAYTMEGFDLFEELLTRIDNQVATFLLNAEIRQNVTRKQTLDGKANDGKEKEKATPKRVNKIGRNEPCPCGSGKKYKQCCGK